jgi:subtilisin family serine protease
MRHRGRIMVVLVTGEARSNVPSQLDCLIGAAMPATRLGDPRVDDVLGRGEDYLVTGVYHSRRSFGRIGEQHLDFDPLEERLGLSRTYSVQLSDPARADEVVQRLRDLRIVESASVQTLAVAPYSVTAAQDALPAGLDPWAPHDQVHVRQAHDTEPGDQQVWVGLVDTGISLPHPEFQRKLLAGYDTVRLGMGGDVGEMRLVGSSHGDDFAPRDAVGHGSHVGGIVGAHGWHLPPGVAGRSLLLPIRVLAAAMDGKTRKLVGVGALPDINAGLKVAVDLGADVLNLSFGTPASAVPDGPPPHHEVVAYAAQHGCILVAAMGNSGMEERYYPAAFPEVIAVGSVDADGRRSAFSTTGVHIAISAPGQDIVSAGMHGYNAGSGTSYAAPFVTGAAALLLARARRHNRKLNGTEVRKLLVDSASPLGGVSSSPETGAGLLQVASALRTLDAALGSSAPPGSPL